MCETSIKRMVQLSTAYEMQHSALPQRMIVPAYFDGGNAMDAARWTGPTVESPGVEGREALSADVVSYLRLREHHLTFGEVRELVNRFGINEVVVLNNPDDVASEATRVWGVAAPTTAAPAMYSVNIHAIAAETGADAEDANLSGLVWPMVGAGVNADGDWVLNADWDTVNDNISDPDLAYRLFLGVGMDSSIVGHTIVAAGECPVFAGDADPEIAWGWYGMVLPRLEATVDRLAAPAFSEVTAATGCSVSDCDQRVTFDLTSVGDRAAFDIVCPEGCRFAAVACEWTLTAVTTP